MAYDITAATTGTTLSAGDSNGVAKLYRRTVEINEQENDFWQEYEGMGEDTFIQTVTETSKGAGQKITIRNTTGFYMDGRMGDEQFDTNEMFEKSSTQSYDLEVDWLRNAHSMNARGEEYMGIRGELKSKVPQNLAAWMGREKGYRMDQLFLRRGDGRNYLYANGKLTLDLLRPADVLSVNQLITMKQELIRVGAAPGLVGKAGRNRIHKYMLIGTTDALTEMKKSTAYQTLLREAGEQNQYNPLFRGGYYDLDGQVIKERFVLDHDGPGPIGSSLNPRALLGTAVAAGTAAFTIKGGGSTARAALKYTSYFRHFPNFPVEFMPNDTIAAGTASFYIAIINPLTAETDPGKWGFYRCSANGWSSDLNIITIDRRLGSADETVATTNIRDNVVGNVTWDADVNTDVHPVGSLIVLTNSSACPIGYSIMLGQRAAFRGYGKYRNDMPMEYKEGSGENAFIMRRYIQSVFGQKLREDFLGRKPGFLVLGHAINCGVDLNPTLVAA